MCRHRDLVIVCKYSPGVQRRSSAVTRSTPSNRFLANSSMLSDSGRRPDSPVSTTSSPALAAAQPFTALGISAGSLRASGYLQQADKLWSPTAMCQRPPAATRRATGAPFAHLRQASQGLIGPSTKSLHVSFDIVGWASVHGHRSIVNEESRIVAVAHGGRRAADTRRAAAGAIAGPRPGRLRGCGAPRAPARLISAARTGKVAPLFRVGRPLRPPRAAGAAAAAGAARRRRLPLAAAHNSAHCVPITRDQACSRSVPVATK